MVCFAHPTSKETVGRRPSAESEPTRNRQRRGALEMHVLVRLFNEISLSTVKSPTKVALPRREESFRAKPCERWSALKQRSEPAFRSNEKGEPSFPSLMEKNVRARPPVHSLCRSREDSKRPRKKCKGHRDTLPLIVAVTGRCDRRGIKMKTITEGKEILRNLVSQRKSCRPLQLRLAEAFSPRRVSPRPCPLTACFVRFCSKNGDIKVRGFKLKEAL
ncbi:hypothetical protein K0M31_019521, partial [Melipona bicolor]